MNLVGMETFDGCAIPLMSGRARELIGVMPVKPIGEQRRWSAANGEDSPFESRPGVGVLMSARWEWAEEGN